MIFDLVLFFILFLTMVGVYGALTKQIEKKEAIQAIRRVVIGPNDFIVFKVSGTLTREAAERFKEQALKAFQTRAEGRIVVLDASARLDIVNFEGKGERIN